MDGSQQCTSLPDSEPQRDPVVETKEPMNIESLVTIHRANEVQPCSASGQSLTHVATIHKRDDASVSHSQQGNCSNYNNLNMELFNQQNPRNTLDSKLADLFPRQHNAAGYFQNVGKPLKFVTPLVQEAMQSAPASTGQMPLSLSTATAPYSIRGQVAVPQYPPCVAGDSRMTTPSLCFVPSQRELPCVAVTATASATSFSNIPTTPSTLVTDTPTVVHSKIHAESHTAGSSDSQPGRYPTVHPSVQSVPGPSVPRTALVTVTPQSVICTQCSTATLPVSQPRIVHNAMVTSPRSVATDSGNPGLSSNTVSVTVVNEKVPTSQNTSQLSRVPNFQPGRVDAKKFPPRYYDMSSLEIGTWKYKHKEPGISRLKVIFSQRKFIYEFQLNTSETCVQDSQPSPWSADKKKMVCVEVPFRTVVGINISSTLPAIVVIEVDTVPAMWLGTQIARHRSHGVFNMNHYNTLQTVDLTDGQLLKVPYHKLTISSTVVMSHLMRFDARFSALLQIPIKIDPSKAPPEPMKTHQTVTSTKRKRTETDQDSNLESNPNLKCPTSVSPFLMKCSCNAGCATRRCICIKNGRQCQDCRCLAPCKNPLNIMQEFGVDLDEAKKDSCLMQKLAKIYDLRTFLRERTVLTPCCGARLPLKSCCVGVVECPECETEYRYSWCSGDLCDEENRPRNHCEICQTCRDYRDQHCSRCNRCYFAGLSDFPCPCRNTMQLFNCFF